MNHRKQARNHPAADVGVGIGATMMALGVLTRAVRDDSFWGTLFALLFLAAIVPWTIKATRYAVQRRPDNSAYNGGRPGIQPIMEKPPEPVLTQIPTLKIPGDAGLLSLAEVEEALTGWSEKFKAAPPKVDALSYDGDPRLSPGFWEKEAGESESDYWRRLCGHDDTVPGHRHLLTCPDWVPGQI